MISRPSVLLNCFSEVLSPGPWATEDRRDLFSVKMTFRVEAETPAPNLTKLTMAGKQFYWMGMQDRVLRTGGHSRRESKQTIGGV